MPQEVAEQLIDLVSYWSPWFALAVARPLGFAMLFAVFAWGNLNQGMIRMAFAMVLALPALSASFGESTLPVLELPIAVALVKEIMIGALLGFIASLPLAIATSAGSIVDFYRGAMMGQPDPAGGEVMPVATLFAVIAIWTFANLGGFWVCASILYSSYNVWPVQSGFPVFTANSGAVMDLIEHLLLGALVLAGPLLLLMFLSDLAHLVSSKFGKQINVTYMAFSSKNILMIVVLPFFMVLAVRAIQDDFGLLNQTLDLLRMIIA